MSRISHSRAVCDCSGCDDNFSPVIHCWHEPCTFGLKRKDSGSKLHAKTKDKPPRAKPRLWLLVPADEYAPPGGTAEESKSTNEDCQPTLAKFLYRDNATAGELVHESTASVQLIPVRDSDRKQAAHKRSISRRSCCSADTRESRSDCLIVPLTSLCTNSKAPHSPNLTFGSPRETRLASNSFFVATPVSPVPDGDVSCNISVIELAQPSPESMNASESLPHLITRLSNLQVNRPSLLFDVPETGKASNDDRLNAARVLQRVCRSFIAQRKFRSDRMLHCEHHLKDDIVAKNQAPAAAKFQAQQAVSTVEPCYMSVDWRIRLVV